VAPLPVADQSYAFLNHFLKLGFGNWIEAVRHDQSHQPFKIKPDYLFTIRQPPDPRKRAVDEFRLEVPIQ
jgi:hypothetical protein